MSSGTGMAFLAAAVATVACLALAPAYVVVVAPASFMSVMLAS